MLGLMFPADGSAPRAVPSAPSGTDIERSSVHKAEDKSGVVGGHHRSDWNLWIRACYKERFALNPEDAPNRYFRGMVRGDIFVSVLVDDGQSGDLTIKIPPLSVGSVEEYASILDTKAQKLEHSEYQFRFLRDKGFTGRTVSGSEIKCALETAGLMREESGPSVSAKNVETRIFEEGTDQSAWVVEGEREAE